MSELNNFKIGLASYAYDVDGAVMIAPLPGDTDVRQSERRVTRTKTLDGGCIITDGGVAAGDRTFTIVSQSNKTLWDLIRSMHEDAQWVTVSTDEACYLAKIERIQEQDGKINLSILIKEDLTV
jgi:hypothetical protein